MVRFLLFLFFVAAATCPLVAQDHFPGPDYPPEALKTKAQGTVHLVVTFREDGSVKSTHIARSSGSRLLDDAAQNWVRANWKASPETLASLKKQSGKLSGVMSVNYQYSDAAPAKQ